MLRQFAYVLLLVPLLGACGSMKIEDFKGTTPELKIEEYFLGKSKAWGIFEDRFGNLKREFVVDIEGTWDGNTLTLVEDFVYSDGETDQRIWVIDKVGENRYEGTAGDFIVTAIGVSAGKALTWSYDFDLKVGGNTTRVHFEDWFYLQDDEVLVNRTDVTKFGIKLGTATIFFRRLPEQAAGTEGVAEEQDVSNVDSTDRGQAAA